MVAAMPRRSARVVVVDRAGNTLLFCVDDPETDDQRTWITPGGSLEDGESLLDAACRELTEETGYRATPDELGAPVAWAEGDWQWRGRLIHSVDTYFALAVDAYEPDRGAHTELERQVMGEHRWWSPDELDACADPVFPLGLAALVRDLHAGRRPTEAVQLPWT
jgi:8-oxo-dGTP pyrophosphatase MutT (NUDIX family)